MGDENGKNNGGETPDFHVVLGVSGSIAAYRSIDIASALTKRGIKVDVVMTAGALKFATALSFGALTHRPVTTDLWDEDQPGKPSHIELADRARLVLVAPASADMLARMAHGFADDTLTAVLLATPAPVVVAPAMNGKMWLHPATQANVELLKSRGVAFIGPDQGLLACGYEGIGRMWPVDKLLSEIEPYLKG